MKHVPSYIFLTHHPLGLLRGEEIVLAMRAPPLPGDNAIGALAGDAHFRAGLPALGAREAPRHLGILFSHQQMG